jgi:hypothetical protein
MLGNYRVASRVVLSSIEFVEKYPRSNIVLDLERVSAQVNCLRYKGPSVEGEEEEGGWGRGGGGEEQEDRKNGHM